MSENNLKCKCEHTHISSINLIYDSCNQCNCNKFISPQDNKDYLILLDISDLKPGDCCQILNNKQPMKVCIENIIPYFQEPLYKINFTWTKDSGAVEYITLRFSTDERFYTFRNNISNPLITFLETS